jgi:hypothetical protein
MGARVVSHIEVRVPGYPIDLVHHPVLGVNPTVYYPMPTPRGVISGPHRSIH